MATGPQQKRKELREKRLKAEAAAKGGDRRQNLMKIIGISAFVAIVAVVIIVVALSGGGDDSSSDGGSTPSGTEQLAGIPQSGTVLGDPKAKVTLVEYGDLQCPICKAYAEDVLPGVIDGPIKAGDAKFDFQQWAILGEDSTLAAKAALAAAEQDKYWEFIETFYADQGVENTGYVTDEFLTDIAEKAGVPDIDQWNEDREKPEMEDKLLAVDEEATQEGFTGTPSFAIRDADGQLTTIEATSADPEENVQTIKDAIKEAQG